MTGTALAVACFFNLARWSRWQGRRTLAEPLLWVLHLGYLWLTAGLGLTALSALGAVPEIAAIHALTAGAIGTLTLGMMARVTLGHTGRKLEVSPLVTVGSAAIVSSGLLRVLGPWLRTDLSHPAVLISAGLWSLAFALYVVANLRYLITPRPDGKPG